MGTHRHTICVKHFPFTTSFLPSVTSHFAVSRKKPGTGGLPSEEAYIEYLRFETGQHQNVVTKCLPNTRYALIALMKPDIHAKS